MLVKGKAPRCDGMPTDVYRTWPRMVKCLAEAWASRQDLSSMGGQGKLVLIFKKKGEKEDISN